MAQRLTGIGKDPVVQTVALHYLDERFGVRALGLVRQRVGKRGDTRFGRFGFVVRHSSCLPSFPKISAEQGKVHADRFAKDTS